jgi:hypothetical protein
MIGYFLTNYFLDNEYYLGDLCLSPYIMVGISSLYFISGLVSLLMIQKSKFLFPYMLYIFNLIISVIGLLHFAACTILINVIADASYQSIYISQFICYIYHIKWIKNEIYEQNEKKKSKENRQHQSIELRKIKAAICPYSDLVQIVHNIKNDMENDKIINISNNV